MNDYDLNKVVLNRDEQICILKFLRAYSNLIEDGMVPKKNDPYYSIIKGYFHQVLSTKQMINVVDVSLITTGILFIGGITLFFISLYK